MDWYLKNGLPCDDIEVIETLMHDTAYKVIGQTPLFNGLFVSTVWLGLNHNFLGDGPPLIFETMVFLPLPSHDSIDMQRYATEEEAKRGHEDMCNKWKPYSKKALQKLKEAE
jgi:hypothetical protein